MKDSWGAIEPAESSTSRLRLDFGLRSAILRFNEWAVPGLGGAFFVRQLSWSCMGLRLAPDIGDKTTAARIAEGLEALAGWVTMTFTLGERTNSESTFSMSRANSDGVFPTARMFSTSGLEMSQNAAHTSWPAHEVDAKLHTIMVNIHKNCCDTAAAYGTPGNYVNGANIAGFLKVANAMMDQGLV